MTSPLSYYIDIFPTSGHLEFAAILPSPRCSKCFTLLLSAGITPEASIRYKDEANLLEAARDPGAVYTGEILPVKMRWNLDSISRFSFFGEIATMFKTLLAVLEKEYA